MSQANKELFEQDSIPATKSNEPAANLSNKEDGAIAPEAAPVVAPDVELSEAVSPSSQLSPPSTCCCGYWGGWCSFPLPLDHGRLDLILAFFLGLVALVFCDAATDVCGFVKVECEACQDTRKVGLNVYEDGNGECTSWRKGEEKDYLYDPDDILWKVARWFVGIASVVSLLLLIAVGLGSCIRWPRRFYVVTALSYQVVFSFYFLSYLVFGSDLCTEGTSCTWSLGASLMAVGILVWIPASYTTLLLALPITQKHRTDEALSSGPRQYSLEEARLLADLNGTTWLHQHQKLVTWFVLLAVVIVISVVVNLVVIL